MSRWLTGLNPEQRRAVETLDGPLLVLAGAGSGKTRVITHRIAHLLEQRAAPEQVLAVTFTNKAAAEMRERLRAMVGERAAGVTMSTFHSLGLYMLREEARRARRSSRFAVYDAGDQQACLRELAGRLCLGGSYDLGAVAARISAWKNAFVAPEAVEAGDDPYAQAAAALYPAYQEALEAFDALDFDDLIVRPTRLLERSENCRQRWAQRFAWVLVDEYQDTNAAQLRLLRAIAGAHRNLCAVGDDDQSIYAWRGAQVRNILRFETDFGGCARVELMRNYRSVGSVLRLANAVIALNEQRHPKRMRAVRGDGPPARLVIAENGEAEAEWVADRIEERLQAGRQRPGQIAVLYRSNSVARGFEAALRARRIGYRVLGGKAFFDRKEVKDLTAYLRICAFPADAISLRRVINTPARGIGPQTVGKLAGWADARGLPLAAAVERADAALDGADRALPAVQAFAALVRRYRQRLRRGPALAETVRALVTELELKDALLRSCATGKAFELRWGLVEGFIEGLAAYCARSRRPSLREYLSQVALLELDRDADEGPAERVTLSTLHGSKGAEWDVVYLVGLEEGLLPHERVLNPQLTDVEGSNLAEERRLCYVGITRARDELVLSRAARRRVRGKLRARAPSRFIAELPESVLGTHDLTAPLSTDDARQRLAQIRAMLDS